MKLVLVIALLAFAGSAYGLDSIKCSVCEAVVGKIQGFIEANPKFDNATVALIENDLCSHLPAKDIPLCDAAAEQYIPNAIDALVEKVLDPKTACGALHLCESMNDAVSVGEFKSDKECKLCEMAADWVAQQLESNVTDAHIVEVLEKACSVLPADAQAKCKTLLESEGPAILADIGSKVQAEACQALKICTSAEEVVPNSGMECAMCKLVIAKAQTFFNNNTGLDEKIEEFLENDFCTRLPTAAAAECNATVAAETPAIMSDIAEKLLDPDTDCTAIGMCTNSSTFYAGLGSAECDLCSELMTFLDSKVFESNTTQATVEKALEGLCAKLPAKYSVPCTAAAAASTAGVMDKIGQFLATSACVDIHACPKPSQFEEEDQLDVDEEDEMEDQDIDMSMLTE